MSTQSIAGNQSFSIVNNLSTQLPELSVGKVNINSLDLKDSNIGGNLLVNGAVTTQTLTTTGTAVIGHITTSGMGTITNLAPVNNSAIADAANVVVNSSFVVDGNHVKKLLRLYTQVWAVPNPVVYPLQPGTDYLFEGVYITGVAITMHLPDTSGAGPEPGVRVKITLSNAMVPVTGPPLTPSILVITTNDNTPFRDSSVLYIPNGTKHYTPVFVVSENSPHNTTYKALVLSTGTTVNSGCGAGTEIICVLKADPITGGAPLLWEVNCRSQIQGTGLVAGSSTFST